MLSLDCLKLQMEGKYLMRTFNALPCGGRGFSECLVFKGFLTLICEGLIFKKKRCVVQLLCMVTIKDDMPSDLKVRLDFSDAGKAGRRDETPGCQNRFYAKGT